jgi:hypothetical protein
VGVRGIIRIDLVDLRRFAADYNYPFDEKSVASLQD